MKNEKCTLILEAKRSRVPCPNYPGHQNLKKEKERGNFFSLFLLLFKFLLGFGTPGMSKHVLQNVR